MQIKRLYSYLILVLVSLPLVMHCFGITLKTPIPINSLGEKASKPIFNGNMKSYLKQYNTYFATNYYWRDYAIFIYNQTIFGITKQSPVPDKVLIGKDNYLFLTTHGYPVDDYQGYKQLTQDDLDKIYMWIHAFKVWLDSQGIEFYYVIAPDKSTIYPEKLPDTIRQVGQTTADQITEYLSKRGIQVVDLRPILLQAKSMGYDLYYRTDGHWNKLGAYVGYKAIIQELSKKFKVMRSVYMPIHTITYTKPENKGDLYRMMGIESYPYFYDVIINYPVTFKVTYDNTKCKVPRMQVTITQNINKKLPKLLMYRDSFGDSLQLLLANNFCEAHFIWEYLWLSRKIDTQLIKKVKPDVVIIETVERYNKFYVTGVEFDQ